MRRRSGTSTSDGRARQLRYILRPKGERESEHAAKNVEEAMLAGSLWREERAKREEAAAVKIQRRARQMFLRSRLRLLAGLFRKRSRAAVVLQSFWRRVVAVRRVAVLRAAAEARAREAEAACKAEAERQAREAAERKAAAEAAAEAERKAREEEAAAAEAAAESASETSESSESSDSGSAATPASVDLENVFGAKLLGADTSESEAASEDQSEAIAAQAAFGSLQDFSREPTLADVRDWFKYTQRIHQWILRKEMQEAGAGSAPPSAEGSSEDAGSAASKASGGLTDATNRERPPAEPKPKPREPVDPRWSSKATLEGSAPPQKRPTKRSIAEKEHSVAMKKLDALQKAEKVAAAREMRRIELKAKAAKAKLDAAEQRRLRAKAKEREALKEELHQALKEVHQLADGFKEEAVETNKVFAEYEREKRRANKKYMKTIAAQVKDLEEATLTESRFSEDIEILGLLEEEIAKSK